MNKTNIETELLLIRHGQTDWNLAVRYQGQSGHGLNPKGVEQAHLAATRLNDQDVTILYSSDQQRTMETAAIIGEKLGLAVVGDSRLREIHLGKWQGMTYDEIDAAYPNEHAAYLDDPTANRAPGAGSETMMDVYSRAVASLNEIALTHPGERVAIITHSDVVAVLRWKLSGQAPQTLWSFGPDNAEVVLMDWPMNGAFGKNGNGYHGGKLT